MTIVRLWMSDGEVYTLVVAAISEFAYGLHEHIRLNTPIQDLGPLWVHPGASKRDGKPVYVGEPLWLNINHILRIEPT